MARVARMTHIKVTVMYAVYILVAQTDGNVPLDLPDEARLVTEYNTFCQVHDMCDPWLKPANLCCGQCSCDPTCARFGTCCPDVIARETNGTLSAINPEYACQKSSVRGLSKTYGSRYMIARCPDDYPDEMIAHLCHATHSNKAFEETIPVNDNTTHINYKNKYCAVCNGADMTSLIFWNPNIECLHGAFHITSYDTLVAGIEQTEDCDIAFQFHDPLANNEKCTKVISECNTTGLWRTYDAFTERACHAYSAPYAGAFQNHYCARCNEYEPPSQFTCGQINPYDFLSFTALLKLPPAAKPRQILADMVDGPFCNDAQMYDSYKNKCRDLVCHPTRLLNGGTCIAAYTTNSGMCYELFIELSPLQNDTISAIPLAHEVEGHLQEVLQRHYLASRMYAYRLFHVSNASETDTVGNVDDVTLQTGSSYVAYAMLYWEFATDDYPLIQDIYSVYDNQTIALTLASNTETLSLEFAVSLTRPRLAKSRADSTPSDYMLHNSSMTMVYELVYALPLCASDPITVTQFLECPAVKLESDYSWETRTDGVLIAGLDWFVSDAYYNEADDVSITVCADDLDSALRAMKFTWDKATDDSFSIGPKVQGILSLVLAMISVLCLLITFITYCLFPVLRGQPGKHNMVLCLAMASAYTLYVFGVHQTHLRVGCTILAVCIHFSWIFTFFWQNVCSFHMFRDFNNLTKSLSRSRGARVIVMYMVYALLGTAIVMSVNIGVTYYRTDGNSYGYGSGGAGLCYLHDRDMVIYMVAVPLLLLVVANITMFVVVVVRLRQVTTIKRHVKNERNLLAIYAKLSTLTGLTWVTAIPLYVTELTVFEYIFIVLNASQGVYIMVAFVCNRRVMNLYKELWSNHAGQNSQMRSTVLTNLNKPSATLETNNRVS